MWCFRDDEEVYGNPLVAGFQEDLAPDDELKPSDRSVSNIVLHNELSSDEDVSTTALRPSSLYKDSLPTLSNTTNVSKSSADQQIRKVSVEPRRNPADADVTVDSSEDEVAGCGAVVRQEADISDDEQQNAAHISTERVRSAF